MLQPVGQVSSSSLSELSSSPSSSLSSSSSFVSSSLILPLIFFFDLLSFLLKTLSNGLWNWCCLGTAFRNSDRIAFSWVWHTSRSFFLAARSKKLSDDAVDASCCFWHARLRFSFMATSRASCVFNNNSSYKTTFQWETNASTNLKHDRQFHISCFQICLKRDVFFA